MAKHKTTHVGKAVKKSNISIRLKGFSNINRNWQLYYKQALICEDTDYNRLRRVGYLIRKNMDK